MQPGEFVRAVLGVDAGIDGYARFVVVEAGQKWPGKMLWKSAAELREIDPLSSAEDILGLDLSNADVFFTPHLFSRVGTNVTKDDVVAQGVCSWVECDDADLKPDVFVPTPSLVVETSPGRHHFYWLLSQPVGLAEIEQLNWRLVRGNGLVKDVGGWHLVKFLRLPATRNHKRSGKPSVVRLLKTDVELRYAGVEDARFDVLPDAPSLSDISSGKFDRDEQLPSADTFESREQLEADFLLNNNVRSLLDEQQEDRSTALWRIYNSARRLGMTAVQCYWLVSGSANDKFSQDWRYNKSEGLWHDICRAYAAPMNAANTSPMQSKITELLRAKGPSREKHRAVSHAIFDDLVLRGRVYYDQNFLEPLYLDTSLSELDVVSDSMQRVLTIDPRGKSWGFLMASRYGIVESHPEYRPVTAMIAAMVQSTGNFVTPHKVAHFNTENRCLYVYNNGRTMYRLDGKQVVELDNGAEGILFRDTPGAKPFHANMQRANGIVGLGGSSGSGTIPTLYDALFSVPNYVSEKTEDDGDPTRRHAFATPHEAALLAQGWLYSLFFPEIMAARPHLVITGPTASGKTLFFQLMLELFFGEGRTVTSIPGSKDAFENTVSNHHFIFYDNVDTPNAWFTDSIAEVATGIEYQRRILYTTNDNITVHSRCYIGMTTRDPWFSRTDVATRLVVLEVERRGNYTNPLVLLNRIRRHRADLWGELLCSLNRMVAYISAHADEIIYGVGTDAGNGSSIRVAAFDKILRIMEAVAVGPSGGPGNVGINADKLVALISQSQASGALEHSALWSALSGWLERTDSHGMHVNLGRAVRAKDLYASLRFEAGDVGTLRQFERSIASTRSLGRQLQELLPELRTRYDVEVRESTKGFQYVFWKRGEKPTEESKQKALDVTATLDVGLGASVTRTIGG